MIPRENNQFEKHAEYCGSKTKECEICGAKLKAMELESHLATGGCEEYLDNKNTQIVGNKRPNSKLVDDSEDDE